MDSPNGGQAEIGLEGEPASSERKPIDRRSVIPTDFSHMALFQLPQWEKKSDLVSLPG